MKKIIYMIKRIFAMNYSKFFNIAKEISKKTKKPYIFVLFDIIYCGLKHGAGYMDYYVFEMYNLNEKQRKTYVTRGRNNEFIRKYNDKSKYELMDNKALFNKNFNEYLKRDWIFLDETDKSQAISWIEKHNLFIAKNILGTCGKQVKKIETNKYNNSNEIYDELINTKHTLLEEYAIQHTSLMNLHPYSVNTIRMVTLLKNNRTYEVIAFLRIGNGGYVDNLNSGGMTAPIDLDEGIIKLPATDKEGNVYYKHPLTNVDIVGFKIPYWNECKQIVEKASKIIPEIAYCGWDICVTENGPCFIEANPFPGHDIYQLPIHVPDKIGLMPRFQKIENEKI